MRLLVALVLSQPATAASWQPFLVAAPDNPRCLSMTVRFDLAEYAAAWCESPLGSMEWRPFYQDTAASDTFAIGSNATRLCLVESSSAMSEMAGVAPLRCFAQPHVGGMDEQPLRVGWQPLQPLLAQAGYRVPPSVAAFAVRWAPPGESLSVGRVRVDPDGCLRLQGATFCAAHGRVGPLPRESGLGGPRGVALHLDLREVRRDEPEDAPPEMSERRRDTSLRDVGRRASRIARRVRRLAGAK